MNLRFITIISFCFAFVITSIANASSSAAGGKTFHSSQKISAFAKKVERTMAKKGARVFLISRVGMPRNKLPRGINYTHTGIAVYTIITAKNGKKLPGYAIYNLYQRDKQPNVSDLVVDFPADFFMGAHELETGIIIPAPKLQKKLFRMINSNTYRKLHNPKYSVLANPFNSKFQNCTEFILDVINAAIYRTDNLAQIKRHNKAYFKPQKVRVGPITLMLGTMFKPEISVSDHDGKIATATFSTLANYMEKYDLAHKRFTITANN